MPVLRHIISKRFAPAVTNSAALRIDAKDVKSQCEALTSTSLSHASFTSSTASAQLEMLRAASQIWADECLLSSRVVCRPMPLLAPVISMT
jgi:hypothetical protein